MGVALFPSFSVILLLFCNCIDFGTDDLGPRVMCVALDLLRLCKSDDGDVGDLPQSLYCRSAVFEFNNHGEMEGPVHAGRESRRPLLVPMGDHAQASILL